MSYENGMTEELFRYELDMHFLQPSSDDQAARDSDEASSSGTAGMSEAKTAGEGSAGDSSDDDDLACF